MIIHLQTTGKYHATNIANKQLMHRPVLRPLVLCMLVMGPKRSHLVASEHLSLLLCEVGIRAVCKLGPGVSNSM